MKLIGEKLSQSEIAVDDNTPSTQIKTIFQLEESTLKTSLMKDFNPNLNNIDSFSAD